MDDLPARVYAGIGTTSTRDRYVRRTQHRRESALDLALHGAETGLGSPTMELRPVVGKIDP